MNLAVGLCNLGEFDQAIAIMAATKLAKQEKGGDCWSGLYSTYRNLGKRNDD